MSSGEEYPHRWPALAAAVTSLFMTLLDLSIVIVALPTIRSSLGASASQVQWVVSAYALAFGIVPIVAGRLGDDLGRKRMLLVGAAAFVLTSAASGFAPSIGVLIGARVVQGLAGGLLNPQVSGIVQQMFGPGERGRAFGLIGLNVGIATAAGPVIGGLLIGLGGDEWGWRLCFLVNLPVGLVSLVACSRLLPGQVRDARRTRGLDLPGVALLACGLLGVLYPFVQFDAGRDYALAWLFMPAVVLLLGFWWWERGPAARGGHPLIEVSLFRVRSFTDGVVLAALYFVANTGTTLVLSLFLQDGLGYSALRSGLTATAFAAGSATGATFGGRLVRRLGRRLVVVALVLFTVGVGAAALVAVLTAGHVADADVAWAVALPLFVAGLGGGGVITPNQTLSLADVDARGGSTAGGMLQTSQRLGSAVGTALVTATFYLAASGAAAGGAARSADYGGAYATALCVSVVFGLCALVVAVREARGSRRPATPDPAAHAAAG